MQTEEMKGFEGWGVLELMGHVRLAGRITQEKHFGVELGRIAIPKADGGFITQFFGGSSVYRLTPVTEEVARAVAAKSQPAPIHSWEMPKASVPALDFDQDADDDERERDDP